MTAKDSSGGTTPHDGTLVDGPVWLRPPGGGGGALQSNGAGQQVALGNIFQDGYQELSIACWVKHEQSGWENIVERSAWDNPDGIGLLMDYNTTSVSFGHYGSVVAQSKTRVQDGRWHHVAGTLAADGTNYVYSIYVDGKLDNTATGTVGLTATANGWAIGARYDGTWPYHGLVADVRLYDCALTAAQVQAIYQEQNSAALPTTPATGQGPLGDLPAAWGPGRAHFYGPSAGSGGF